MEPPVKIPASTEPNPAAASHANEGKAQVRGHMQRVPIAGPFNSGESLLANWGMSQYRR